MEDTTKKVGAFDKFEDLLNRYLGPIAEKMDKQPHLSAVKKSYGCYDAAAAYRFVLPYSLCYPQHDRREQPSVCLDRG